MSLNSTFCCTTLFARKVLLLFVFLLSSSLIFAQEQKTIDCGDQLYSILASDYPNVLQQQSYVDLYSRSWLASLQPIRSKTNVEKEFGINLPELIKVGDSFRYIAPNKEAIRVKFTAWYNPMGLSYGASNGPKKNNIAILVTFIKESDQRPVAFWGSTIAKSDDGKLIAVLDYVKTNLEDPALAGYGKSYFPFYSKLIHTLGISEERLEADWLGRLVWAQQGFLFDPSYDGFTQNGKRISQLSLVQNNFRRFLAYHQIDFSDLRWVDKRGKHSVISSISEIKRPADFLRLAHKDRKVLVRPYIDYNKLDAPLLLDVGRAFLLFDYRPDGSESVIVGQAGKPLLSDKAMPIWVGVRTFQPD